MKLFFLVSSLDLTQPFSATPAWWQLLKGLYEIGVEVIAAPYQGPAIETLWWRAEPNAAKLPGDVFKAVRDTLRKMGGASSPKPNAETGGEAFTDKAMRNTAHATIEPLWRRQIDRLLAKEPDIDAVVFVTIPLNHVAGLAQHIQEKFQKPVFYYDGDVPASLPDMRGFATGFRIYQGADLAEYAAFISNSKGGEARLLEMGANAAHTLYYGADPDVFSPVNVPENLDVFFYGHGREYRDQWIENMIAAPARALPEAKFAVRGPKLGDLGAVEKLPYLSFSKLREYASRSKLNLVITRDAHAGTYASSSSRPFELAALGCCMVANPYSGIEEWFEPGKEIFIVNSAEEAVDRYRYLLQHDPERIATGAAARARLLKEHTFRHRSQQLVEIIRPYLD
ncbi:MAG: glycosyltransferase [Anaerolineae bacterium]|nr:glycosyltransferase [Anaerolineae bacterium]